MAHSNSKIIILLCIEMEGFQTGNNCIGISNCIWLRNGASTTVPKP